MKEQKLNSGKLNMIKSFVVLMQRNRFLPGILPCDVLIQRALHFLGKLSELLSIYCPGIYKNS